jgi:hypothetical protein
MANEGSDGRGGRERGIGRSKGEEGSGEEAEVQGRKRSKREDGRGKSKGEKRIGEEGGVKGRRGEGKMEE